MKIAKEALTADAIDVAAAFVLKGAKNAQGIAKIAKRKSIMTMAQPGMYQYPLIASNAIDTDTLMNIVKSYQLTYASNVATAYSLNPIMYTKDTPELSDFVTKFHTNSDSLLTAKLDGVGNMLNITSESATDMDITVESATIDNSFSAEDLAVCNSTVWDDASESLTMDTLNDMYRPYDRVYRIMKDKVESMKPATEDFKDSLNKINNLADDINQKVNSGNNYSTKVPINPGSSSSYKYDKDGNVIGETVKVGNPIIPSFKNEVVRNNQLDNMEPTMVNVQIVAHGDKTQMVHNLTLGVKVVSRVISSDLMIASMVEACKNANSIFKFLKWTKGEVKTLDFILGFSAAKTKAIEKNAKQEVKFLKQSASRKKVNGVGKFLKNEKLPTMSVVLTTYEVARIKDVTNVDLNNFKDALKLLNKYFLLSIAIYDPDQNIVKFLFDCDTDWGVISVGTMKSVVAKTNDILNQNEIMRITGRR